jgi:uncharacterized protein
MKILLSPAKSLNWQSPLPEHSSSLPSMLSAATQLIKALKKIRVEELQQLMDISPAISSLNVERYRSWTPEHHEGNSRPAIYAFDGDVYHGLDAYRLSPKALEYASQHLRILSGLYGLLKPFDLIQPYRLEMGTSLAVGKHDHLYSFWGNRLAKSLNEELQDQEVLIHLASDEYFKALPTKVLKAPVIRPVFYDFKNNQYKIISFFAKKARGSMARYICEQQLTDPEHIKAFDSDGYSYSERLSTENKWVFLRG